MRLSRALEHEGVMIQLIHSVSSVTQSREPFKIATRESFQLTRKPKKQEPGGLVLSEEKCRHFPEFQEEKVCIARSFRPHFSTRYLQVSGSYV